jgi:hypothetical protein
VTPIRKSSRGSRSEVKTFLPLVTAAGLRDAVSAPAESAVIPGNATPSIAILRFACARFRLIGKVRLHERAYRSRMRDDVDWHGAIRYASARCQLAVEQRSFEDAEDEQARGSRWRDRCCGKHNIARRDDASCPLLNQSFLGWIGDLAKGFPRYWRPETTCMIGQGALCAC